MDELTVDQEAERLLRTFASEMTEPEGRECLACFVMRMRDEFGCDHTLRFAARFRDLRAPRATALERRLLDLGAYCDCELAHVLVPIAPYRECHEYDDLAGEPFCRGVRRGSTQPCDGWYRRSRRSWR